jgi:hypothetical protein
MKFTERRTNSQEKLRSFEELSATMPTGELSYKMSF